MLKRLGETLFRLMRDRRGMTVVELVVLMVLLVFVLAVVYLYFDWGYGSCDRTLVDMRLVQDARTALLQIDREARNAEDPDGDQGEQPLQVVLIPNINSYPILFIYSDVDGDGQPERICYFLKDDGGSGDIPLYRHVVEPENRSFPYTYITHQQQVTTAQTQIALLQPVAQVSKSNTDIFSGSGRSIKVKLVVYSRAAFMNTDRKYEVTAALPLRVE